MTFTVNIPDTISLDSTDYRFLKEGLIALLYYKGKLSSKEACDVLEVSRRQFEDLLPKFGFSILSDDISSLSLDLES